ncbi:MAG: acyl-CoA mutase large subunit family protein [Caldilineaceae bacterium]|nr:acyl-CoA mutase large subunit family protein [Caldilineaceae bacterium]
MDAQSAAGDGRSPADATSLLAEFTAPTLEEWHAATVASLKGAPLEKLTTHTYEGIDLQPLYRAEDAAELPHVDTLPGEPPFVRGRNAAGYLQTPWAIAQAIDAVTPAEFNRRLLHDLNRGQTAINLTLGGADGVAIRKADDMRAALDQVDYAAAPIFLNAREDALPAVALLAAALGEHALAGAVADDPLGDLADRGTLSATLDARYDEMAELTRWAAERAPNFRTISVGADRYQNAGADAVTEAAVALSTGVAYLRAMLERNIHIDTAAQAMVFTFGLGSHFFMEIAKLRAARLLWSQAVDAFGGSEASQAMTIHGCTATWNKTVYDPHVNMLRVTTEAFSGVMGGVQSMQVAPFDAAFRPADEFSRRIARNTQLILQQECNLTRLVDPAGGSWYVERLTDQIARAAWQRFQAMEADGGPAAALEAGTLQADIAATADARIQAVARRRDVLVGINLYAAAGENPPRMTSPEAPKAPATSQADSETTMGNSFADLVQAAQNGATLTGLSEALARGKERGPAVTPLTPLRVAAPFEALRDAANRYAARTGHTPVVFLANMGPPAQHKARADFTQGFVSAGGFVCDYPAGFETADAAARAALASGAQAVVICSTDDTYPAIAPDLAGRIKAAMPDMPVLLAGYPADQVDALRAAGVDEFIHLRADCYAVNAWLHEQLQ